MPKILRAHKIALDPNNAQATYFAKASGVARHAYNWSLAFSISEYEAGRPISGFDLKKAYRVMQDIIAPWSREVTKCAPEQAIADLNRAFKNFWAGRAKYPTFHKKGVNDSFYLSNDQFKLEGKRLRVPNLGWIRMREELRFEGKILGARITRQADRWFISIQVETELPQQKPSDKQIGIDLGLNRLATGSDGLEVEGPKPHKTLLARLRMLNKELSRRQKTGKNWTKTKEKIAKLHRRIANIRKDAMHKLTTGLVQDYGFIGIEDLNVKGMVKNHKLARSITDQSFGMFRSMLEYKAKDAGVWVQPINRFFPSTRMCRMCGREHDMPMDKRTMQCDCGHIEDRDLNASHNILIEAIRTAGSAGIACCHGSSGVAKAA